VKLSSNVLRSGSCCVLSVAMREDGGDLNIAELALTERSVLVCSEGDSSDEGGLVFLRPFAVSVQRCASSFMSGSSRVTPSRTSMVVGQKNEVFCVCSNKVRRLVFVSGAASEFVDCDAGLCSVAVAVKQ
jgi:hypothetical protein